MDHTRDVDLTDRSKFDWTECATQNDFEHLELAADNAVTKLSVTCMKLSDLITAADQ